MAPRPLLVNASELLRRAGSEKLLDCDIVASDIALQDDRFDVDAVIHVALRLESLTDGIVVEGQLHAPWHGTCRRCLRPIVDVAVSHVNELYQLEVTNDEAFPIVGDQLNLADMVRECVVLDTPYSPLCRTDCRGLCLQCGADRNDVDCSCEAPKKASQWDVLDSLRSQLDEN